MTVLTLADLKAEVGRVGTEDDTVLTRKLAAAQRAVATYLKDDQWLGDGTDDWPEDAAEAVLLCAVSLYDEPEADPINATVAALLEPHRYELVV